MIGHQLQNPLIETQAVNAAMLRLLARHGGVYWPMQESSGSVALARNTALAEGRNISLNGTFAADASWTKGAGWSIGSGVATHAAGTGSDLEQAIPIRAGASYKLVFTLTVSIGTITPKIGGTSGTVRSTAATFTETIVAGAGSLVEFTASADFAGTIDDVAVTWLNIAANNANLNGTYANSPSLAQSAGRLGRSVYFNGTNQDVNVYSPELNSMINPTAGTLLTFINVAADVWTEAVTRYPVCFGYALTDYVLFMKHAANYLLGKYAGAGSGGDISYAPGSIVGYALAAITWDTVANQVKQYVNGVQVGATKTGFGSLGLLHTGYCRVGSYGGASYHKGHSSRTALLRGAMTGAEMLRLAQIAGVA